MKLYTNGPTHSLTFLAKIAAEYCQLTDVEVVIVSKEQQETEEFKAKRQHGKFPMLELDDGSMVYESMAIAQYIARRSATHGPALLGKDAMEEAQVQQWMTWGMCNLGWPSAIVFYSTLGVWPFDEARYQEAIKIVKEKLKVLNNHLQGKTFLVGNRFTLADAAL